MHWYHHFTVLLYCWHSYATRSSAGLYFAAMNYGVHALMYFYYFLSARGIKAGWAGLVTTLQISQMFIGVGVCTAVWYYQSVKGVACDVQPENQLAGILMYASYGVLFIVFALEKYIFGVSSLEKGKKAKAEESGEGVAAASGAGGSAASDAAGASSGKKVEVAAKPTTATGTATGAATGAAILGVNGGNGVRRRNANGKRDA